MHTLPPLPAPQPVKPLSRDPASANAYTASVTPSGTTSEQSVPQSITVRVPAASASSLPLPTPVLLTVKVCLGAPPTLSSWARSSPFGWVAVETCRYISPPRTAESYPGGSVITSVFVLPGASVANTLAPVAPRGAKPRSVVAVSPMRPVIARLNASVRLAGLYETVPPPEAGLTTHGLAVTCHGSRTTLNTVSCTKVAVTAPSPATANW